MSRVRSSGNDATELRLIRIFRLFGIKGWRRNAAVFGKPDFVFPIQRVAVFVDGCFWHSCPRHGSIPAANRIFWSLKLKRNRERDIIVRRQLKNTGWTVLRIWQHELKKPDLVAKRLSRELAK
jgi:DNA mismatch endonuclease (patch repair protein)